jgi:hypothetical protein
MYIICGKGKVSQFPTVFVGTLRSSKKVEADTILLEKGDEISILKFLQAFMGLLGKGLTRQIIYQCKHMTF